VTKEDSIVHVLKGT